MITEFAPLKEALQSSMKVKPSTESQNQGNKKEEDEQEEKAQEEESLIACMQSFPPVIPNTKVKISKVSACTLERC